MSLDRFPPFANDAALVKKYPSLRAAWEAAYPNLDIDQQLAAAYAWLLANKPKKNHARFLTNWMAGAAQRQYSAATGENGRWRHLPVPPEATRIPPGRVVQGVEVGKFGGFIDVKERLWRFSSRGEPMLVKELHANRPRPHTQGEKPIPFGELIRRIARNRP